MTRRAKIFLMCIIYICTTSDRAFNKESYKNYNLEMEKSIDLKLVSAIEVNKFVGVRASDDNNTKKKPDPVKCEWDCQITVSWIGRSMNSSVDPCDDFYEFTCGHFGKYPERQNLYNRNLYETADEDVKYRLKKIIDGISDTTTSKLERLVKTLYDNCMGSLNAQNLEAYEIDFKRKLASGVYVWPVLLPLWNISSISYFHILSGLFEVDTTSIDLVRQSPRIKIIDQGLDNNILKLGMENEIVQAYYLFMVDIAVMCGAIRTKAEIDLREALKVAIQLANDGVSDVDSYFYNNVYTNMTVDQLDGMFPDLQIGDFLSRKLSRPVHYFEQVVVPKGFTNRAIVLTTTPHTHLLNLISWYKIIAYVSLLEGKLHDRFVDFYRLFGEFNEPKENWRICIRIVKTSLPLIMGAFYQRQYISRDLINEVKQMVNIIHTNVVKIVQEASWLDQGSISEIVVKLNRIKTLLPYRSEYEKDKLIEEYYEGFELAKGDVMDSVIQIHNFVANKNESLSTPKLDDWSLYGDFFASSSSYNYKLNSFDLPVTYLSSEYYNVYQQKYLNYATLGLEIAHLLGNFIDSRGIRYNSWLSEYDWFPSETLHKLNQRIQCFIEQAGNYKIDDVDVKMEHYRKIAETIAANVGTKAAYRTYENWAKANIEEPLLPGLNYTRKQMFWIAFGNSRCKSYGRLEIINDLLTSDHLPAKLQVNGVLSNRPEFAKDFGCKAGSKMNPVSKCAVW